MIQPGKGKSFTSKTLPSSVVLQRPLRKDFEGDIAFQAFVVSQIDHAHSAGSNLFENAVMPQRLPNHW
jgi:hypothetical protein